ncbi:hypothetical protein ColTof4_10145 [Colletotrichum tofieldiae]|nr:hypothetical protein ColTof3_06193 [Colletotrichum tofieldiae]GKT77722.1 hypothetical protein ColTof4_10145 [Colletotrichum tofieldiae]
MPGNFSNSGYGVLNAALDGGTQYNNNDGGNQYNFETQRIETQNIGTQNIGTHHHHPEKDPSRRLNHSKCIPFDCDPDFVDRDGLLDWVRRTAESPPHRVALFGMGGIGKSHVALEYVHSLSKSDPKGSPPTWVFWVRATTRAHILADFAKIAGVVKLPGRDEAGVDILSLVCNWLGEEENSPWVMVFDGADDAESFSAEHSSPESAPLRDLLRYRTYGSIIITTRDREVAKNLFMHDDRRCIIEVKAMSQAHAIALLGRKMKMTSTREEIVAKQRELVDKLDRIPLAITQAASYITEELEDEAMTSDPCETMSTYLDELRQLRKVIVLYDGGNPRRYEKDNSVFITWQKSFDRIQQRNPVAADLLCSMSFFDRSAMDQSDVESMTEREPGQAEMVQRGLEEASAKENGNANGFETTTSTQRNAKPFSILIAYSLVKKEAKVDKSVYTMHRLVQKATRYWLEVKGRLDPIQARHIQRLAKRFPEPRFHNWEACGRLYLHAKVLMHHKPKPEYTEALQDWARVLCRAGDYAVQKAISVADSEVLQREAMDTMEKTLGRDHRETLDSGSSLARTLAAKGDLAGAELLYREIYKTSIRGLGESDRDTLSAMGNLANICILRRNYEEAERLVKNAMKLGETSLDDNHPDVLNREATLTNIYVGTMRYDEAKDQAERIARQHKSRHGPEHPDTIASDANVASTYAMVGLFYEAEELQKEIVERSQRSLGEKHRETLVYMANLAYFTLSTRRMREVVKLSAEKCSD